MKLNNIKYRVFDYVTISFKDSTFITLSIIFITVTINIIPLIQIFVFSQFIDRTINVYLRNLSFSSIIIDLCIIIGLIGMNWYAGILNNYLYVRLENKIRSKTKLLLLERCQHLRYPDIESPETNNLIKRVLEYPEIMIKDGFYNIISLIASIIRFIGIVWIFITYDWLSAFLFLLFSFPLFYLSLKSGKSIYDTERQATEHKRRFDYYYEILTNRESVGERIVFDYKNYISKKFNNEYDKYGKLFLKTRLKSLINTHAGGSLTSIAGFVILLVLIKSTISGHITLGTFISLTTVLFSMIMSLTGEISTLASNLSEKKEFLNDLNEYIQRTSNVVMEDLPKTWELKSIEFRNVSFRYPGTEKYVLKSLSFKIDYGNHYAFVGANGSGKTTITKLALGLYDNFEGEILINGTNILNFSRNDLKKIYATVFQDFAKYSLSLEENMTIGSEKHLNQNDISLVIKQLGMESFVNKMPEGLKTHIGKLESNGVDISGGEWQKVAMARALLANPYVFIFDEPTSALDPQAESDFYNIFTKVTKDKTSIFITHRLGATRFVDEIFVLDEGKIIESGNHESLIRSNGLYNSMYSQQKGWYY